MLKSLALAGVCAIASAAVAGTPEISAFGSLPMVSQPRLSPDGSHLAVVQSLGGRPAAVIYTTGAPKGTQPKVITNSRDTIWSIAWAKNDRLLITVNGSRVAGSSQAVRWYRTMSVDANGENPAMMFANSVWRDLNTSTSVISDLALDDPTHVYMPLWIPVNYSAQNQLYRVDVRTGAQERVMNGTAYTADWIMDGQGHVVGRVERFEHPLTEQLSVLDGDNWKSVGTYDASGGRGAEIAGLSEDGRSIVRYAREVKTDTAGLVNVDRAGGPETKLYFPPGYDVDEALTDEWTSRVIGASYTADREEYHYFDAATENLQRGLEAAFPGKSVHAVSWNTTKDRVIVEVEAPRAPPAYFFVDRTQHSATHIASAYPGLSEDDLGEMKPYPYKARDGLDIPAYLTLPPGKEPKTLPVILMPHGGPGARDQLGFDWMAAFFANRGYAVLQPNFRGSTGYGGKFQAAGYGEWGLKMQDDLTDGVRKLIADGIADPKRICIVGASYGGYAALTGAMSTPDLYACAVGFAGVYDLRGFLRNRAKESGGDPFLISTWNKFIGNRFDDAGKLDAASPALNAAKIKCPVLLMHGSGDTTVPVDQSEEMRDALTRAGKQVGYVRIDGETHYLQLADSRIRFLTETEKFLKANIGN
jgi:dipeptidyl aminopeptidase/acylaminoacyl peptidase